MDVKVFNQNGRVTVTVMHGDGNLDSTTHDAFLSKAHKLINDGTRCILIDLSNVKFISSAGFRTFYDRFSNLRSIYPDTNLNEEDVKRGSMQAHTNPPG